jgi:hypothetical protein
VELDRPAWAPAPGQAAVFYDGVEVLGGGRIAVGAPSAEGAAVEGAAVEGAAASAARLIASGARA